MAIETPAPSTSRGEDRLAGADVLRGHEPARQVGADGQDGQVGRAEA
jgi:hypothetical protein